jgi:hypothetical protein
MASSSAYSGLARLFPRGAHFLLRVQRLHRGSRLQRALPRQQELHDLRPDRGAFLDERPHAFRTLAVFCHIAAGEEGRLIRWLPLNRGRHQPRSRGSTGVNLSLQRDFEGLPESPSRVRAREAMIQQNARVAGRIERQVLWRQVHAGHESFHRTWPAQMGVRFGHPGHQTRTRPVDDRRPRSGWSRRTRAGDCNDAIVPNQDVPGIRFSATAVEDARVLEENHHPFLSASDAIASNDVPGSATS